jgi:hypothetical protein
MIKTTFSKKLLPHNGWTLWSYSVERTEDGARVGFYHVATQERLLLERDGRQNVARELRQKRNRLRDFLNTHTLCAA